MFLPLSRYIYASVSLSVHTFFRVRVLVSICLSLFTIVVVDLCGCVSAVCIMLFDCFAHSV